MSTEPGLELDDLLDEPFLINLLFKSFRTLQKVILPALASRGHSEIGLSETRLLLSIGTTGLGINRLAELTGSSRQYVSRLVHELEGKGYLQAVRDPSDARASVIGLDEKGLRYVEDLREVKKEIDTRTLQALGQERLQALIASLKLLNETMTK